MAGSGVAVRLHEFRQSQDSTEAEGAAVVKPKVSRQGRDVQGIYPGQLGRVHSVPPKDCGYIRRSGTFQPLVMSENCQLNNYQPSFEVLTLRALSVLHHSETRDQRPPQTSYQDDFGLQSSLWNQ